MSCELCVSHHEKEIWRDELLYVIQVNDPDLPGFIRIIASQHIAEMSDLSAKDRAHFWEVIHIVESCVRDVMKPEKINLASLGNMVPHLHWHIVARFKDDAFFPGSPWSSQVRKAPESSMKVWKERALHLPDQITLKLNQWKEAHS